eukprot:2424397-Rhodomonas_salina.1
MARTVPLTTAQSVRSHSFKRSDDHTDPPSTASAPGVVPPFIAAMPSSCQLVDRGENEERVSARRESKCESTQL